MITQYPRGYFSHAEYPDIPREEQISAALENKARWAGYCAEVRNNAEALSRIIERRAKAFRSGGHREFAVGELPPYIDCDKSHSWTCMYPWEARPEQQWFFVREAGPIDPAFEQLPMHGVDPNVTYAKCVFIAPIGSTLIVDGEFPRARFMDLEINPPLDPAHPSGANFGENPEVPIVDVDIDPLPGHTNPFRVGERRFARRRRYRVEFSLELGNAVDLNGGAMVPPYRAAGNRRVGGPFAFLGPGAGDVFIPGCLWYRIYAPDRDVGPLGGVRLPKVWLRLPSGEWFWIQPDTTLAAERQQTLVPAGPTPPQPVPPCYEDSGWLKPFGSSQGRHDVRGYETSEPWTDADPEQARENIRRYFGTVFGRGENAEPPGNHESSTTLCNYISYLRRQLVWPDDDTVYVITGKMPVTPRTRDGQRRMKGGQARYWSVSLLGAGDQDYGSSVLYGCLMDDEVVLDDDRNYTIVISAQEARPANATPENGVTWLERGPRRHLVLFLRWMSVVPEWYDKGHAPDSANIPWPTGCWSGTQFDPALLLDNKQTGPMGTFQPHIAYMTKEGFDGERTRITDSRTG